MIAEIRVGDALRELRAMADRSVAGIVTAPPVTLTQCRSNRESRAVTPPKGLWWYLGRPELRSRREPLQAYP